MQRMKRGEPLTFEYIPHYGGLPENVTSDIKAKLTDAKTAEEIDGIFDASRYTAEENKHSDIMELAKAINKLAEKKES